MCLDAMVILKLNMCRNYMYIGSYLPVCELIPAALQQTHSRGHQLPSPPELD